MRGTVLYGARDVRYEEVPEPKILKPTDAIIRLAATCVCGSDLWSYRGINEVKQPMYMAGRASANRKSRIDPSSLRVIISRSAIASAIFRPVNC